VTAPELYKYIYAMPKPLPRDLADRIIRKYSNKGVRTDNVNHVIDTYEESLRFANIASQLDLGDPATGTDFETYSPLSTERKIEVEVDGQRFSILDRYLIEAYEKTLQHDLVVMREKISITNQH
jgi:hypothetical protein